MAGGAPDSVVAGRFLTNETCSDIDRMRKFPTNEVFLAEIAKAPSIG